MEKAEHLVLRNADRIFTQRRTCLLYTSDAADERSSVDLGGRRIIKKKNSDDVRVIRLWISTNEPYDHITQAQQATQSHPLLNMHKSP